MGVGDWDIDQNPMSLGPDFALSAESRVKTVILKITATPEGGKLLGTLQPVWRKATESDMRLKWLGEMLRKDLCVREIQSFGENINDQLRAESSKEEEISREALMSLMEIKHKDERRNYRECAKVKEQIKDWMRKKLGRGKVKTILVKLNQLHH